MQQDLLTQMEDLLNHGGMNYTTFLHTYAIDALRGVGLEDLVKEAIGKSVVIANVRDVLVSDIELDLRECLGYVGDAGAGPEEAITSSREFRDLLEKICKDMKMQSEQSNSLKSFRFKEGHPAYPVFWDFAYAFLGDDGGQILVCSSSD